MRKLWAGLVLVATSIASTVVAQPRDVGTRPEDVQAAAAAFGEGQRAQLRGEYARAADLFELADRSAPNAVALRSAIRSHRAAAHLARAATLALAARERHVDDAETVALAEEVIAEASASLGRLSVACAPACSLAIDGRAVHESAAESFELFVDPGARRLIASWPGHDPIAQELSIDAGASRALELTAPEATTVAEPIEDEIPADDPPEDAHRVAMDDAIARPAPPPPPSSSGISPAVFATGAALTAVALGIGIGFGVDTLSARDAYVASPTREGYEDGVGRQSLANGFLFGAAALGIATAVIAIFTDWDGGPSEDARGAATLAWIVADEHGLVLGLTQSFGGDT